ncbi:MAG: molybdenum cofactor biosynthesis protein MoaE [Candidatus Sericytochromatia bacterium]|uniref:Molybdenum cofactor biosynthesis protein MoaE n=1 Tax=Candidatus Tanganyikabacteria bacterium TaxID=2961651 RepID=A0A937X646_9BACT|nr:molybdenum cofactor biosynthesis protein MoaE [Candidatus Tanganyikabacteria bacterium]
MIEVSAESLDKAAVEAFLEDPAAGARVVFEGIVRNHHDGRRVLHLEYEAYAEMAARQMAAIAGEIKRRWPAYRVAIVHRVGRLEIGEAAVIVGVSTAHRADAFEACRFGIDRVKADVPIWKREFYADGTSSWQDNHC